MPDFEFVKAVDERLVSPSVDLWDFFNLKYIIGQGPTYVRSVSIRAMTMLATVYPMMMI